MGCSIFGICVIFHNKKGLKTLINLIGTNYTYKASKGAQKVYMQSLRTKDPVLFSDVPGEKHAVGGVLAERPALQQECGGQCGLEPGLVRMLEGHGCQQGPWL